MEDPFVWASSLASLQNEISDLRLTIDLLNHNVQLLYDLREGRADTMGVLFPIDDVSAKITSYFGERQKPTEGASTFHKGIDIAVPVGTNVNAATSGIVKSLGYNSTSGNYLIIDNGSGLETAYRHLKAILVKQGETVNAGQIVAKSGNTGISTGPHLHFETIVNGEAVNPLTLILGEEKESSTTINNLKNTVSNVSINALNNYWIYIIAALIAFGLFSKKKS